MWRSVGSGLLVVLGAFEVGWEGGVLEVGEVEECCWWYGAGLIGSV